MLGRWRRPRREPAPANPRPWNDAPAAARESADQLLRRLEWTVIRPLALRPGGNERSRARGGGLDLAELREYQPGDDVRRIDWNATARAGSPQVRETYAERALDAWLLVDVSPSVDWGTARQTKRAQALELVAAASQVIGRHGNRVGALTFAERPLDVLPPATGRHQVLRIVSKLREAPRREVHGRTDLAAALCLAGQVIRRPALVVVVSDFLVEDGWAAPLGQLAVRHELVAVRVTDPREGELPDVGIVTLEDPESGEQLIVDTADRRLRERFREAARAQAERIDRLLTSRGARRVIASTDAALLPTLLELLDRRRRTIS